MTNRHIARRTLLTRTSLGMGAVFGASFGAGLGCGPMPAEARAGPGGDVWSQGYRAEKVPVRLAMYRKWNGNLRDVSPAQQLPVLFLVHGSSLSAMSSFDLDVPGDDYSMMDAFAGYGFDVWTMDHEGFGHSSQTSGTSDIA